MARKKLKPYEVRQWMRVKDPAALRRWRKRRGYTQRELAFLVKKTQATIHLLESGNMRTLSEALANAIADRLDVDREELFDAEREKGMPETANAVASTRRMTA